MHKKMLYLTIAILIFLTACGSNLSYKTELPEEPPQELLDFIGHMITNQNYFLFESNNTHFFKKRTSKPQDDRPSYQISYEMFQSGKTLADIATMRDVQERTIENHLFQAFKEGKPINWEIFFNDEEEAEVLQAREQIEEPRLRPLKEALPDDYDYTKIKAVLVKNGLM